MRGCRSAAAPRAPLGNVNSPLLQGGLLIANPLNSCAVPSARVLQGCGAVWGTGGSGGGSGMCLALIHCNVSRGCWDISHLSTQTPVAHLGARWAPSVGQPEGSEVLVRYGTCL